MSLHIPNFIGGRGQVMLFLDDDLLPKGIDKNPNAGSNGGTTGLGGNNGGGNTGGSNGNNGSGTNGNNGGTNPNNNAVQDKYYYNVVARHKDGAKSKISDPLVITLN